MEYLPFLAGHLRYLTPQPEQRVEHDALLKCDLSAMERHVSLSAWHNNVCIGAAGVLPIWPHRAVAWMLLSDSAHRYMLPLTRKVRRVLSALPYARIELTVAAEFEAGHQFARLLGATLETPQPMRMFGINGRDEMQYAILKGR